MKSGTGKPGRLARESPKGRVTHDNPHARSGPDTCTWTVGLADRWIALRHGLPAECVDASPSATCRRRLLPDGVRPSLKASLVKQRHADASNGAAVVKSQAMEGRSG